MSGQAPNNLVWTDSSDRQLGTGVAETPLREPAAFEEELLAWLSSADPPATLEA